MLAYQSSCCQYQSSPVLKLSKSLSKIKIQEPGAKILKKDHKSIAGLLCIVSGGCRITSPSSPVCMKKLSPGPVNTLIGMGTEIIALCLQQIGRECGGA